MAEERGHDDIVKYLKEKGAFNIEWFNLWSIKLLQRYSETR